jgi:hypothetical protein
VISRLIWFCLELRIDQVWRGLAGRCLQPASVVWSAASAPELPHLSLDPTSPARALTHAERRVALV